MKILLVNNAQEFKKNYFYGEERAAKDMPEKFPCIMVIHHRNQLTHEHFVEHEILEIPTKCKSAKDYLAGIELGVKLRIQEEVL